MRRNFKFSKKGNQDNNSKEFKSNDQIRADKVFLINEDGENLGVLDLTEALSRAREADLDLVEVNPKAEFPVVKIMDLGQFKYEQSKKSQKQRVAQKKLELKSIRLSVRISSHDLGVRTKQAYKFLAKGNKIKVEIILRGRERQHLDKAKEVLLGFVEALRRFDDLQVEEDQPLTKQAGGFSIVLVNKK